MGEAKNTYFTCLKSQRFSIMPLLGVKTNVSIKDDAKLLDLLTDAIANGTGKPKGYVSVILEGDKVMAFGGTTEPCAMICLESIGAIEGKQKEMSKAVMTILKDHLGVSPDRSYMMFNDLERKNVGYNLSTFDAASPMTRYES